MDPYMGYDANDALGPPPEAMMDPMMGPPPDMGMSGNAPMMDPGMGDLSDNPDLHDALHHLQQALSVLSDRGGPAPVQYDSPNLRRGERLDVRDRPGRWIPRALNTPAQPLTLPDFTGDVFGPGSPQERGSGAFRLRPEQQMADWGAVQGRDYCMYDAIGYDDLTSRGTIESHVFGMPSRPETLRVKRTASVQPPGTPVVNQPRRTGTLTDEAQRRIVDAYNPDYSAYDAIGYDEQQGPPQPIGNPGYRPWAQHHPGEEFPRITGSVPPGWTPPAGLTAQHGDQFWPQADDWRFWDRDDNSAYGFDTGADLGPSTGEGMDQWRHRAPYAEETPAYIPDPGYPDPKAERQRQWEAHQWTPEGRRQVREIEAAEQALRGQQAGYADHPTYTDEQRAAAERRHAARRAAEQPRDPRTGEPRRSWGQSLREIPSAIGALGADLWDAASNFSAYERVDYDMIGYASDGGPTSESVFSHGNGPGGFGGAVDLPSDYGDPREFGYETPMGTFPTWEEAAQRVAQSDMDPVTTIRPVPTGHRPGMPPRTNNALGYAEVSPEKARKILHDGEVRGHALTDKQRRFFGAKSNG